MKKIITSLLMFVSSIAINIFAQTATLDQTFGQNGRTVIPNTTEMIFFDFDTHGNIIAVGYTLTGPAKLDLTITKTDANGIIDKNFGNDGVVKVTDYERIIPLEMKITNNNKIVVIGRFAKVLFEGYETIIMRFNENGTVDESFGDHGKVNLKLNTGHIISLNLESDDFLLIAKSNSIDENQDPYIVKYSYDGEIDESFGENGMVYLTNSIYPVCMKILNNGSIIIAGMYNKLLDRELGLCKLTPAGVIDSDFAGDGIWHLNTMQDFDMEFERFENIFEDQNQNLILSGSGLSSSQYYGEGPFLCKFSTNGVWDTSFGKNGFSCIDYSAIKILQMENKYITVSWNNYNITIILINDDGSSANEIYTNKFDYFRDIKLQEKNKIILGGAVKINDYDANFALERIVIDLEVSIKHNDNLSKGLQIFPNPAKEHLYFSDETTFEIMDIQGRVLLKSATAVKSMNIAHLKPGIYFVRLGSEVKKFAKIK